MKLIALPGMSYYTHRCRRNGMALIVVVAILAALLVMGATFALLMRMERRSAINLSASEEARVAARNRLDIAIQILESNRGIYDGVGVAWHDLQENDDDLEIIDLDSRFNVNSMGQLNEVPVSELFYTQRMGSAETWLNRVLVAALEDAKTDGRLADMDSGDIQAFSQSLANLIVQARYGADGKPGLPDDLVNPQFYGDLEHRLGFNWTGWNPATDDTGVGYPATNVIGAADMIPSAIRGPDGTAYVEPNVVFEDEDPLRDTHFNPENPIGDDQPFSSFWQVIPVIERALDSFYGAADGPDYYQQVSEALEPFLNVHSHTRSPDFIDINAAIPERLRITGVTDNSIDVFRRAPLAVDSLAGRVVRVIDGTGVGAQRIVAGNDADTIWLTEDWDAANSPDLNSVCIVVEDWAPHANPYHRLYAELGLLNWAGSGGVPAVREVQASRIVANLIDFKDEDDFPTRIDIDAGIMRGPGWATGSGVYGAEGLHITEIMATPARIIPTGDECTNDGGGTNANDPPGGDGLFWDWEGGRWIQKDTDDTWGVWEFTGLKNGSYALKVYGGDDNSLLVRYDGLAEFYVQTNRPEGGLFYGYFRDGGDDLVAVEVTGGALTLEIQGGEDAVFNTIQLLPQFIEITNVAMHSPGRATSHAIDISGWTLRAGSSGSPMDYIMPVAPPFNVVPAVSPDGQYPINYGYYILALSGNAYLEQWGAITNPGVTLFPVGDTGVDRAARDLNTDWMVNSLAAADLMVELHEPVFGLVAGGDVDGAIGLAPLDYIAHQKTVVLGTEWLPYGNYTSSADTNRLISSQNTQIAVQQVIESGRAISGNPGHLNVDPAIYNWTDGQYDGYTLILTAGAGSPAVYTIANTTVNPAQTYMTVHGDYDPPPDSTTHFAIVEDTFVSTWHNERYVELWTNPGVTLKDSWEMSNDGYILPFILNRPYHSRGWMGLVPSGTAWRTIDPAPASGDRDGPEDLLGLLMSRTRTSASYSRININTASEIVLRGLFDDALAQWIVQTRENNLDPWETWDQLLNEADLQYYFLRPYDYTGAGTYADDYMDSPDMREEWFRRFGDLIDIRSSAFLIRASGTNATGEATAIIEAVVDRQRDTTGDGLPNCSLVEFRYVTEAE